MLNFLRDHNRKIEKLLSPAQYHGASITKLEAHTSQEYLPGKEDCLLQHMLKFLVLSFLIVVSVKLSTS